MVILPQLLGRVLGHADHMAAGDMLAVSNTAQKIRLTNIGSAAKISNAPSRRQGNIAQLGEHLPYKQRVTGSSPVVPTTMWPGSSVG